MRMHAMGLRTLVVDEPDTWIAELEESKIIDQLVIVTSSVNNIPKAVQSDFRHRVTVKLPRG